VKHVVTYRAAWDVFKPGTPAAPTPTDFDAGVAEGFAIPRPIALRAADVDIYLSDRRPYWPNEAETRKDNDCFGPLLNTAGQYLTGVSARRSVFDREHHPPLDLAPHLGPDDEAVRGLSAGVDSSGLLWIVEQLLPASIFV
jgi:hypothetical protein